MLIALLYAKRAHVSAKPEQIVMSSEDPVMAEASSREQLKRRVKALEREVLRCKEVEEALRESEERCRLAIEHCDDGVGIVQGNNLAYVNQKFAEIFGCDRPEDLVGKPVSMFVLIDPDDREKVEFLNPLGQQGKGAPSRYECKGIRKNGSPICLAVSESRTACRGEAVSMVFLRDITDQKLAEDALRESEARYRNIFENIQDVYYEVSLDGIILELSPSIRDISGYEREELLGISLDQLYVDPGKRDEFLQKLLHDGKVRDYEILVKDKDGSQRYCSITSRLIPGEHGRGGKIVGSLRDITERKRAENDLRESEQTLKAILDASSVGIGLARNRTLCWANKAMHRMVGLKEGSLENQNARILYSDDEEFERVGRMLYPGIEKSGVGKVETRWVKKGGGVFPCYVQASPVDPSDLDKGVIVTVMDISNRIEAEERIHALTQELIKAQENERQRISRELHDRVAQDLLTLKIAFETLFNGHAAAPKVMEKISAISKALQGCIMTVRDLAYDLQPPGLDVMGLVETISQYCEDFSEKTGLKIDFRAAGMGNLNLDFDTQINLYRLIQEGLNNIRKHADARQAKIKLVAAFPNIILRIQDDGKGFDVKNRWTTLANEKRMGLRSMEERAALLQGKMLIESSPGKGTRISVKIPYKEEKLD